MTDTQNQASPTKAILLYSIFTALIMGMQAGGKWLQDLGAHPAEVALIRNIMAATLIISIILAQKQYHLFTTKNLKAHASRSILGNISAIIAFWSFALLPMAQVTAIGFAMPLFVLLMSIYLLKEKVGPWRIGALIAGFASVCIIAQPSLDTNNYLGLGVALLSAILVAGVSINLRHLGKLNENPLTTVFIFFTFGIFFDAFICIFTWTGTLLQTQAILIPALITGILGAIGQIFRTEAYRNAEASLLAPINYLCILWASLIGWIFWNETIDKYTVLGGALLITSNLIILWREHKKKPA